MRTDRSWPLGLAALLCIIALAVFLHGQPEPLVVAPPAVHGVFSGQFEPAPMFGKGDKPVLRNGHSYDAEHKTFTFTRPNGEVVTVFAGATTDGASIPRPLWWLLPPDGAYLKAAAVHDAGYKSIGRFDFHGKVGRSRAAPYTRAEVDKILDEGMQALGVPAWQRLLIYGGVRAGGWMGWGF